MKEKFWERKEAKRAFVWIGLDIIAMALFLYNGFSWGFAEANWLLFAIVIANIDRIVFPLANLPEPPKLFTFFTGLIPVGALIAFAVSLREAPAEKQQMLMTVLIASLLLWNIVNIGWGIWEKKKLNK